MKRYFYSGHVARLEGGKVTFEFSGIVEGADACEAFEIAYQEQLDELSELGGDERSQYIQITNFNFVEEYWYDTGTYTG